MKILTNQPRIHWGSAVILLFPWFAMTVREQISVAGMTFTLKKFIDNPALIGFILSSNAAFSLTLGALTAFISDYIWTPFGRRRPFLIVGYMSSAILCPFIPFIGTVWILITLIIVYQFMVDFGGPFEALTMETIPSPQRGRAQVITQWFKMSGLAVALMFLIGNFDKTYDLFGIVSIRGETVMYWGNSIFLVCSALILIIFVREEKPAHIDTVTSKLALIRTLIREIARPRILRLMGLLFVMQNLWVGTLQYEALLVTEQWGYSKAMYGQIITLSMIVAVPFIPIAGWLSDRFDRMTLLKVCIFTIVTLKIVFYIYIDFFVTGAPPRFAVFAIGFMKSSIGTFMGVACVPLIFDFVPRNRLGTLACAMSLTGSFIGFTSSNIMGIWITVSSRYLYKLPENTYNYVAAFHWLILLGLLGIVYFFYFSSAVKRGVITRVGRDELKTENPEPACPL